VICLSSLTLAVDYIFLAYKLQGGPLLRSKLPPAIKQVMMIFLRAYLYYVWNNPHKEYTWRKIYAG
jgi:hypothetical protein